MNFTGQTASIYIYIHRKYLVTIITAPPHTCMYHLHVYMYIYLITAIYMYMYIQIQACIL